MADNELMVLIYETMQKQLNQFKDSRVVMQTLCNRVGELERLVEVLDSRSRATDERLTAIENSLRPLKDIDSSNTKLTDSINAMRGTLSTVISPGISLVGDAHKEIKQSVRELASVHRQVMDEFEQYELRLVQIEDDIRRIIKRQLLRSDLKDSKDREDENSNG